MLSPLINLGLLTPQQIVSETLAYAKTNKVKLNCLEGLSSAKLLAGVNLCEEFIKIMKVN